MMLFSALTVASTVLSPTNCGITERRKGGGRVGERGTEIERESYITYVKQFINVLELTFIILQQKLVLKHTQPYTDKDLHRQCKGVCV